MPVPLTLLDAASEPIAMLLDVAFDCKAATPIAILLEPAELSLNAFNPNAQLLLPVVLPTNA
jgi:hypothetical protein